MKLDTDTKLHNPGPGHSCVLLYQLNWRWVQVNTVKYAFTRSKYPPICGIMHKSCSPWREECSLYRYIDSVINQSSNAPMINQN